MLACVLGIALPARGTSQLDLYWPMASGDSIAYNGPGGNSTGSYSWNSIYSCYVLTDSVDGSKAYYYKSGGQLFLAGGDTGGGYMAYTPPILMLSESLLTSGGSLNSQTVGTLNGQSLNLSVTVTTTSLGAVTVAAGTFNNCRRLDMTFSLGGYTIITKALVLAPCAGQIKVAVVDQYLNPLGWQQALSGTVGGASLSSLAGSGCPSGDACSYSLSTPSLAAPSVGQSASVGVTTASGCAWTVSNPDSSWVTVSPMSGTGSGSVTVTADPNSGIARSATITIAGQTLTLSQSGSSSGGAYAGNYSGYYYGDDSGSWEAVVSSSGNITASITQTYGYSYTGSGTIDSSGNLNVVFGSVSTGATFTGQADSSGYISGTWRNLGYNLTGTFSGSRQSASGPPSITTASLLPAGMVGAPYGPLPLAATGGVVPYTWTLLTPVASLAMHVTLNPDGTLYIATPTSATFSFTAQVADNNGASTSRVFTVTIHPRPMLNPSSWMAPAAGGSTTVILTAAAGCSWTAGYPPDWLSFSPASGTGNATLTVTALPNTNSTPRSFYPGSLELDLQVTQAGATPVTPATLAATHTAACYQPGGDVTIACALSFTGEPSALGWSALIPDGWTYVSGSNEGDNKPRAGDSGTLGWSWTAIPSSPLSFTYTLHVPAGQTGQKSITASIIYRANNLLQQPAATPDPLLLDKADFHTADSDRNNCVSLLELTRLIELYNFRTNGQRTGQYHVQPGAEDGMASGPGSQAGACHSADTDRNWRVSLLELTRLIELYNYRTNGQRTGRYHIQPGTEDGFAPGL